MKILLPIFLMALLFACKKESKEDVIPSIETVSGTYRIVKVTYTDNNGEVNVTTSFYPPCHADNLQKLHEDLSYVIVDEGLDCSSDSFSDWNLPSPTVIELSGIQYDISQFDGTSLSFTQGGPNGYYTHYWKKD